MEATTFGNDGVSSVSSPPDVVEDDIGYEEHRAYHHCPVTSFPAFRNETREEAVMRELARIRQYQEKGDVADWETGISIS